jgi:hypothetical protein
VRTAARWLVVLGATPALGVVVLSLLGARGETAVLSGTIASGGAALGAAYVTAWLLFVALTPGAWLGAVALAVLARGRTTGR